jgi:hypothetical protein
MFLSHEFIQIGRAHAGRQWAGVAATAEERGLAFCWSAARH